MQFTKTNLDGVILIKPDIFEDFRGQYVETYNYDLYKKNGIDINFKQDDISISSRSVLRGIHGDDETWKLISCHLGSFYLMVVNNDPNSSQYKKWQGFTLSEFNRYQVLVPPKFGNGHVVMSDRAIFHYKQNTYYNPAGQFTIVWNDPQFGLWWPIKSPILSRRDEMGKFVD
jgi:dTDP-4-dehydrorhamnose 3,5-epimerase